MSLIFFHQVNNGVKFLMRTRSYTFKNIFCGNHAKRGRFLLSSSLIMLMQHITRGAHDIVNTRLET